MRLKRLELFGFKSFADRTVLAFDRDLVGIVGPNGCGKSNVVDAVRWVLGEQRPTSMRGGEMIDVIFKGSVSRPALAVSEVTLVLDNTKATLEGRGAEVSVTRRVYRSGEGEYLVDGERVRLKDVREMLFGTGLGSRGYSVLEQGKIDAVLSANPLDRRAIFEEAAGVSRYRQRKKETESRLKRVEADLLRLDDVLGELRTRERSLKIQAGKARRYLEARDAWREDGLLLARHQAHAHARDIAALGREVAELEGEVEERRRERAAAEENVQARENEHRTLAAEVDRLAAESSELAAEVRAIDERRSQLSLRIEAWREQAAAESSRAQELDRRHEERRNEAEAVGAEISSLEGAAQEARGREEVLAQEARALAADLERVQAELKKRNEGLLELLHRRTSEENRVEHLSASLEPLGERIQRAEERRQEAFEEARTERESAERAAADLRQREEALDELDGERGALETTLASSQAEREALEARCAELELERARLESRVEALLDWDRELEGFEGGARELFRATEAGEGPELVRELTGLLADHLKTDSGSARALDAALGARAQALCVAEPRDALTILDWLEGREKGRVSLVLAPAVPPIRAGDADGEQSALPAEPPAALLAETGVLGTLLEVTRPDEGFDALARALLGDVLLVSDAARGRELVERYPRWRFVTRTGDLVDAAGVSGGFVEVAQGAVGRRAVAAELELTVRDLSQELARTSRTLEGERAKEVESRRALDELRARLELAVEERSRAVGAVDTARARLEDLLRSVEVSEHECEKLEEEREEVEHELARARETLGGLRETTALEREGLQSLEEQKQALEAERGQRSRDEGEARVESKGLAERLEALQARQVDLERGCDELRQEVERTQRLSQEHRQSADGAELEVERLAEVRDRALDRRGELEERGRVLRERERSGRTSVEELRRRGEAITGELEALLARLSEERLEAQRLELENDELERRAQEDFGLSAEELRADFVPSPELEEAGALEVLVARVRELKTSLDKLGPVNLEAVEELDGVSERLEFLSQQHGDVDQARRSLESTLKRLNEESERLFLETFEEIREHFKGLFRQLFGGGRADVSLMPGESVLEAGIEITARPPGRETLPMSLLSGGQRTLTALALLFAVFRSRPSPFCILDEVDAALDDANIGRFLSLIEHSLGDTQYVVVTHNKGTMASCQMLYGVTMAVRGVSHVVSVELDDVDEIVPTARGGGGASSEADAAPVVAEAPEPAPERDAEREVVAEGATTLRTGDHAVHDQESGDLVPAR